MRAARPPVALLHCETSDGGRDVEAAVPLDWAFEPSGRVGVRRLAGSQAAAVIHRGPYRGLTATSRSLRGWVAASGLQPKQPLRIVYLRFGADPSLETPAEYLTDSSHDFVTELQQPVASRAIP
ncbi:MAG: GyrI-like domain-containing protein [bacterium]|nr:GyrI-like domain-containing protein [bacterium]